MYGGVGWRCGAEDEFHFEGIYVKPSEKGLLISIGNSEDNISKYKNNRPNILDY